MFSKKAKTIEFVSRCGGVVDINVDLVFYNFGTRVIVMHRYNDDEEIWYEINERNWNNFLSELFGKVKIQRRSNRWFKTQEKYFEDDSSFALTIKYPFKLRKKFSDAGSDSRGVKIFKRLIYKHFGIIFFDPTGSTVKNLSHNTKH